MKIEPPQILLEIVGRFDARPDVFDLGEVMGETDNAIKEMKYADDAERKSVWAEWAPWEGSVRQVAHFAKEGLPRKVYPADEAEPGGRSLISGAAHAAAELWSCSKSVTFPQSS